ncbi:single-stranded DNA-binding protein 3-like [Condylostylus longicornis]|uniref:single-stranded DNA-binding protein 3-like n=1 Tax=Condylostylus longicornis TaxID=2530218 RepID=UPI00244DCDF2|nr:single-stranded DNA-binding protein 3-like [Condylostylus longicornis]
MNGKSKTPTVPFDAQAREKLALYVYEYLLHVGAQKAAQTFLSEIRWEKNITLGEPPGFLHTWWCVFWDLYCAAPERRDTCDHSTEAKAFHDYGFVNPVGHTNFNEMGAHPFPSGPRYPSGPRPGVRMPQGMGGDFNGPPGPQQIMPSNMDSIRQGGPPGMGPMNPRMNPPRVPGMGPMGPGYGPGGMRGPPPNNNLGPGPSMPPGMGMGGSRPQWQPNSSTPMNYSSPSPGGPQNYGGPQNSNGPPGQGSNIMQSPQDSSNHGGDNMYPMMKQGGNMGGGDFSMGGGPDGGPMVHMGPNSMMGSMGPNMGSNSSMGSMGGPNAMNSMGPNSMNGDGLDVMKNSPATGPTTPRDDSSSGMGDFIGSFGGPGENNNPASLFF